MAEAEKAQHGFSAFLQLERIARRAEDEDALAFTMVNETRRLISYRQAALIDLARPAAPKVAAVSGVPAPERDAPMIRWLTALARKISPETPADAAMTLTPETAPPSLADDWPQFVGQHAIWRPLTARDGRRLGALWLTRDEPWREHDQVLLDRLCDAYAHAWGALAPPPRQWRRRLPRRARAPVLAALALGILMTPTPQSALAPAVVTAGEAQVVAAPLDGVIAEMLVAPNQHVAAGDALFRFDDTEHASRLEIARRSLDVARAELMRARQGAFEDREQSAEIAMLEARAALREAELDYARRQMDYVVVHAARAGVAVFASADDWTGRPVRVGERVLEIAVPATAMVRIDLPVADAVALDKGAPVELFLDIDPLNKLQARLTSASYEATPTPEGVLAYRVEAAFIDGAPPPRIGLHGTAKISGETAPLALYLFRRPLAVARQWLGV